MNVPAAGDGPRPGERPGPISRARALEAALGCVEPAEPAEVSPWKAMFMVPAQDVFCPLDLPDHPHSVRDGYALHSEGTAGASPENPAKFPVVRTIHAQDPPGDAVPPSRAVRVLTGGRIPEGCDTVVPNEEAEPGPEGVAIPCPLVPGRFIKPRGAFMRKGDRLLDAGIAVSPAGSAAMVRAGIRTIRVHRPVTVSLLSLGDELADPRSGVRPEAFDPAAPPAVMQMPADNLVLMEGLLRRYGAGTVHTAVRGDDLDRAAEHLAGRRAHLTITMGGTGHSHKDLTRRAAEASGFTPVFESVALSPGRGIFFAMRGSEALFGLPGPPSAVYVGFHALVLPVLFKLRGLAGHRPVPLPAALASAARAGKGGERLVCCDYAQDSRGLVAVPLGRDETGSMSAMIRARGLIVCPQGTEPLPEGGRVETLPFPGPDGYNARGEWPCALS